MTQALNPLRRARSATAPAAKAALFHLGGYAAIRRLLPSRQLAILRYHAICGPEGYSYADPQICITPDNFARHVAYLAAAYSVISLEEGVRRLTTGAPLPPNAVAITFDDGYADNLAAARTLARHGVNATFFITAGCLSGGQPFWPSELRNLINRIPAGEVVLSLGSVDVRLDLTSAEGRARALRTLTKACKSQTLPVRDTLRAKLRALATPADEPRVMLEWDEVREMHALGMTIGSHTMTHANLPSAGLEAATSELVESRVRLEREIGAPITLFSYPNGGAECYVTPDLQRAVHDAGYLAAVTSENTFASHDSDRFGLGRIEVEESLQHLVFALEVERFAFKPRARATSLRPAAGDQV
jgi:peptidoglycan/xylan/chitin deacetylase (PgdA/CDA1 family)